LGWNQRLLARSKQINPLSAMHHLKWTSPQKTYSLIFFRQNQNKTNRPIRNLLKFKQRPHFYRRNLWARKRR